MSPAPAAAALPRLGAAALTGLADDVQRPSYDRGAVTIGIVHLGLGAFHRAHQAVYTDAALAAGDRRWGILGASLRATYTRDALGPQDGFYALSVRDGAGERLQVIGSVLKVLVAPEDPAALVAAMVAPGVRIVSLTVTEKGYCHDPATGALKADHADIVHDLAHPDRPRSALGFLAEALAQRRAASIAPFTVLCCDNLPANGRTVKRLLVALASLRDPDFGRFVEAHVACPATMVDRIVPATTDADRARISAAIGATDAWPIVTEPFSQWVIEDEFPQGRPDWSLAGAQFVDDVAPFETMKLRLLNGAHSSIAYLGSVAAIETVSDAMADPNLAGHVRRLWDEVTPTLHLPEGADVEAYKTALIRRFENPALRHRTRQIAMDGSQKLPQRLLGTIRDRLAAGASVDRLALGVAAWMQHVAGIDETGAAIELNDPLAGVLRARVAETDGSAPALAAALIGVEAVFGRDLPADRRFVEAVTAALADLQRLGVRATLAARAT